ncbi:ARID DNA-binding domain-containing protein, partial [Tanacetum coccineum]
IDQLEGQEYIVKYNNNKCSLHYMFDEARTKITQEEDTKEDDGSKNVVAEHNKYLDEYFESIDPKEDCSLVKGLEDLKWDRNDVHDYVDEEYIIDSLGGYLSVTLGNKWKKVAELHGLTEDDEEAIKKCYKKFIEMVQVHYETAEKPWHDKKPVENVVDSSIGYDRVKDPQGCEKESAGMGDALEGIMNSEGKITHFGVKLEGNMDNNAGEKESESTTDSNDFVVIV